MIKTTRFLGVDGYRRGWLWLLIEEEAGRLRLAGFDGAAKWTALPADAQAIGVDMPIGLSETGPRACDIAARGLLPKGRKSSVFPPPRRYMLAAADWEEANALGKAREGSGLPRQSWGIVPRIRELDAALSPAEDERVCEVHPEVAFHRLSGGRALPPKKTAEGQRDRLSLLTAAGLEGLAAALTQRPPGAQADDLLDAAVCALVARDASQGRLRQIPETPPRDARGLPMRIAY